MPRVFWAAQGRRNVQEIREYIAHHAPETALSYTRRLMRSTRRLSRHPFLGQVVPEFGRENLREILFGNYRVVYRVSREKVEVVLVIHAARLLDME